MSNPAATTFNASKEAAKLGEELQNFKKGMLDNLQSLENQSEAYQKALIKLQVEITDKQSKHQELTSQITELEVEIDRLKKDNARLRELRDEHMQDLDRAIGFLSRKRRMVSLSRESPESPTHNQDDQQEWW